MTNKGRKILLKIIIFVLTIAIFFGGFFVGRCTIDSDVRAVKNIIEKYKKYYYFEENNITEIISDALLDKYSTYYSKEEYELILNSAKGYNEGFGITLENDTNKITQIIYNSPCDLLGIKAGGILQKVIIDGQEYTNVLETLQNASVDTKVQLVIDYSGDIKNYTLSKNAYKQTFVRYFGNSGEYGYISKNNGIEYTKIDTASIINDEGVGYIKYTSFSGRGNNLEGSVGQFKNILNIFKEQNKTKLILDLRDNGGGYMDILQEISSMVIPIKNNQTPIIAVARDKYNNLTSYGSKKTCFEDFNIKQLVILANSNSASASEVLIGAILDYSNLYVDCNVNLLISDENKGNTRTYGKGIMQTTYTNLDGSAVKLTTAKLTLPLSGKCIHDTGFTEQLDNRIKVVSENEIIGVAINI